MRRCNKGDREMGEIGGMMFLRDTAGTVAGNRAAALGRGG
jgi:hypothetical protein